jgi:putative transposase
VIIDYIDDRRAVPGVEPICAVLAELDQAGLQIAPSTYYQRKKEPVSTAELEEAYLVNALVDLWEKNWGVYGVRKLWRAARRAGLGGGRSLGRDQVGRLMGIAGITGAVRGRHRTRTTVRDEKAARHPDLVNRGWDAPTATDQLWVADFSYVWTLTGFVYVALVVDVYSRRVLGWRVSTSRAAPLVTDALRQALDVRQRSDSRWAATGLVHHSDAGTHTHRWR